VAPRRLCALSALLVAAWCAAEPLTVDARSARRQIQPLVPRGQRLVTAQGAPYVFLYDLDGDGQPEVFALTVDSPAGSDDSMVELARYGRLFEPDGTEVGFRLLAFGNRNGALYLARVVDLGRWRVLAAMGFHRIDREAPAPYALTYIFQTLPGAEHVWVVLPRDLRDEPGRAVFHETLSSEVSALDVDGDGILDVVTAERVAEPASRSETYLTWYRWSGHEFREVASTIVVRTLVRFLEETRTQLLDHDYADLVTDAFEPGAVQRFLRAGLQPKDVIARFFPSAPELDTIRDVVLPEIRESPFRLPSEAPSSVTLDIRVVDAAGAIRFAQIVVAIARNPFVKRQYSLLPTEGLR
jgi:hypothetical protein